MARSARIITCLYCGKRGVYWARAMDKRCYQLNYARTHGDERVSSHLVGDQAMLARLGQYDGGDEPIVAEPRAREDRPTRTWELQADGFWRLTSGDPPAYSPLDL